MKPNNPRYPHLCTIYRMEGESSFSDGKKVPLYEGICRKYSSTSLRTFKTDNVLKGDYALSIPGTVVGIRAGDMIDVTDPCNTFTGCMVTDCYPGNLGTTVYFNNAKN